MAQRVFVHVGTPDSGLAALERTVWRHSRTLRQHRLLIPGERHLHLAAARTMARRSPRLSRSGNPSSAWEQLVEHTRNWDGDVLICHERLSYATQGAATAALASLGDHEVHLVVTSRPPHRQAESTWQRQLRSGSTATYDAFLNRLRDSRNRPTPFWHAHALVGILDRWAKTLDPKRVHVLTVPASGDASVVWKRYASLLGVDPGACTPQPSTPLLGAAQTEFLRRMHAAGDYRFRDSSRDPWSRKLLAMKVLSAAPDTQPIAIPSAHREWLTQRGAQLGRAILERGCDVVGAVDELETAPDSDGGGLPAEASNEEIEAVAEWTIGRLQEEWVRLESSYPPPSVNVTDGIPGAWEMLEHIRAAKTGSSVRPAPPDRSRTLPKILESVRGLRLRIPTPESHHDTRAP